MKAKRHAWDSGLQIGNVAFLNYAEDKWSGLSSTSQNDN